MKDPRKSIVFKSVFGIVFLLFLFAIIVNIIGYTSNPAKKLLKLNPLPKLRQNL